MSKNKKFLIVVSMVFFCSALLSAQPSMEKERGPRMMQPGPGHMLMHLKMKQKELKITDDQMEKIKNLHFALEEKRVTLENQSNLLRLQMEKLMMNDKNRDYNKIKAVMNKMSDIRNSIVIENMKTRDAVKSILTPEQQEALEKDLHKSFKRGMFPPNGMKRDGMRGMDRDRGMDEGLPGPGRPGGMHDDNMEPGAGVHEEQ